MAIDFFNGIYAPWKKNVVNTVIFCNCIQLIYVQQTIPIVIIIGYKLRQ